MVENMQAEAGEFGWERAGGYRSRRVVVNQQHISSVKAWNQCEYRKPVAIGQKPSRSTLARISSTRCVKDDDAPFFLFCGAKVVGGEVGKGRSKEGDGVGGLAI